MRKSANVELAGRSDRAYTVSSPRKICLSLLAEARIAEPHGKWRAELELAEACRGSGGRQGEQRHYRAAVRAWRETRP